MLLGKKIELRPNKKQLEHLAKHAGVARFTFNWGLSQRIESYKQWELLGKPKSWKGWYSYPLQHKKLNLLKKKSIEEGGFPWMYEVSKCSPQEALRDLDKAFKSFLSGKSGYPRFKSKNKDKDSFRLTGTIKINPQYTSQRCSKCGFISKENRKTQAKFQCLKCNLQRNADWNASLNILQKGLDKIGIDYNIVVASASNTLNACGELIRPRFKRN